MLARMTADLQKFPRRGADAGPPLSDLVFAMARNVTEKRENDMKNAQIVLAQMKENYEATGRKPSADFMQLYEEAATDPVKAEMIASITDRIAGVPEADAAKAISDVELTLQKGRAERNMSENDFLAGVL